MSFREITDYNAAISTSPDSYAYVYRIREWDHVWRPSINASVKSQSQPLLCSQSNSKRFRFTHLLSAYISCTFCDFRKLLLPIPLPRSLELWLFTADQTKSTYNFCFPEYWKRHYF